MKPLASSRLDLIPATLECIEAELEAPAHLGRLLSVEVPASWPPGEYDRAAILFLRDRLVESPEAIGWYGWYAIQRGASGRPGILVGAGGFFGPPASDGVVELGYSIVPEFQARGLATEMVRALVAFALGNPGVKRVIAHTIPANAASIRVLERCGFRPGGPGRKPGTVRYERAARRTD